MCAGKDSFLTFSAATGMNTFKETCAFKVMKEDGNEGRQGLGEMPFARQRHLCKNHAGDVRSGTHLFLEGKSTQ